MDTFYWLIDGVLAGCSRPGGAERGGEQQPTLPGMPTAVDQDLAWLRAQGVGALLSLTETPLAADLEGEHDLRALHLPVPDLHAPTPDTLLRALDFIDRQRSQGRPVAVHCLVGEGRTGTVLAAFLIREGLTPAEALARIRAIRRGAVGTPAQERALEAFARRRDWVL